QLSAFWQPVVQESVVVVVAETFGITPRITRSVYRALYVAKNQATLAVVLQGLGFVGMLHRIQEAALPRKRYARWRSTADLALFYLYGTVQVVIVKPPLIAIGELPEHGST